MNIHSCMNQKKLHKELNDQRALKQCADRFDILGDLTRLKICWLLCKYPEMSVGKLAGVLEMEQSAVSHALRKLKDAGVVSDRKESKYSFYSLNDSPLCSFIKESIT